MTSRPDEPIRLALIIPTMDGGGAEKQLALLASSLPRPRYDVHVFLLTRGGVRLKSLVDAGIPTTIIGKRFKADVAAVARLRSALRKMQPDIVHTWLFAANALGRIAALGLQTRDASPVKLVGSERCVDPWKRWWHHRIDRTLAARSHAMTTNSKGVVDFYAAHGISRNLFRVIANGIPPLPAAPTLSIGSQPGSVMNSTQRAPSSVTSGPPESSEPSDLSRRRVARELGLDHGRRWIVAVGRLWPQKRYRDAIWAAELVGELRRDTTLVIVGEGPQQGELLRHRDAVTNDLRVRFVGHQTDVFRLLRHADVFWNASEYEGQSNAMIEAMQHRVAVVASDIPGNQDLVIQDQTGLLYKLGDTADLARKTVQILGDEALEHRLAAAAARRIATEFSVQTMVDAHRDLYESL